MPTYSANEIQTFLSIAGASILGLGVKHESHAILTQCWAQINIIKKKNTFINTIKLFWIDFYSLFTVINPVLTIFTETITWSGLWNIFFK